MTWDWNSCAKSSVNCNSSECELELGTEIELRWIQWVSFRRTPAQFTIDPTINIKSNDAVEENPTEMDGNGWKWPTAGSGIPMPTHPNAFHLEMECGRWNHLNGLNWKAADWIWAAGRRDKPVNMATLDEMAARWLVLFLSIFCCRGWDLLWSSSFNNTRRLISHHRL